MRHYCVISHTHWDREWYRTQEEFRIQLIDLFDHLLEILDTDPDYVFHMDAQTIVFEDYWEVRPEMREKCCKYIREGRILAGPWYVQNDFFLTSGEATVRNLLIGMKQAEEMGGCGRTGYTPDQFGLISQLPQILRGFDIDHLVFGRGYSSFYENEDGVILRKHKPAEFIWKSPDGSEVLAVCMPYWYNNAQRFSANIDRAYRLTKSIGEMFEGVATTPYLLLMNGVDHLEPQPDLLPILTEVQKRLTEDEKIYQTSLEHYVELVREAKPKEEMPVETGELMQGTDDNLLKDTASSRIYLKIKNSELQNTLENRLEPLYSLLELYGMDGVYPAGHMDYLWKMLVRNHAHDSICGCSTDAVHRHMEDRFEAIGEVTGELLRRGMRQLAAHVREDLKEEDYQLVVFNGLEYARTEVVDAVIDIIAADEPAGIRITAPDGREVAFEVLEHYTLMKSVFSPINLPGKLETVRYKIRMLAENVPAFGYSVYRIQTGEAISEHRIGDEIVSMEGKDHCLENEHLKVRILPSGEMELLHKESGQCYKDFLTVQDTADIGNAYIFKSLKGDVPVDIADFTPEITITESGAFSGSVRLHYDVTIPACYDTKEQRRSRDTVTMPLELMIGLKKGSKALDVSFALDNRAKDHRMCALIRTGIDSDIATSTAPYDLISRNKWDIDTRICNETEHNSGMVAITGDNRGIAVLNRGIYGYENLQREQGTLAFPIIRCTGAISVGVESDDEAWKIPENQCLRVIKCEMAILPQCGTELAVKAAYAAKAFQNPLMVQCEPVDTRKFLGGRPAVQDTAIAELFYQDIPYADVSLERMGRDLTLHGQGLLVTAFKKAHDREGYILRFFNQKEEAVDARLSIGKLRIGKVWKTNLKETGREELSIDDHQVNLNVGAKEIVTLLLR